MLKQLISWHSEYHPWCLARTYDAVNQVYISQGLRHSNVLVTAFVLLALSRSDVKYVVLLKGEKLASLSRRRHHTFKIMLYSRCLQVTSPMSDLPCHGRRPAYPAFLPLQLYVYVYMGPEAKRRSVCDKSYKGRLQDRSLSCGDCWPTGNT